MKRWVRSYRVKGRQVRVEDAFELAQTVAPNVVNFMTWGSIDSATPGKVRIAVGNVQAELTYDARQFSLAVEPVALTDPRLSNVWGKEIYRLSFTAKSQKLKGKYAFTLRKL